MNASEGSAVVRRARDGDLADILDLLAYYDRPRSYFEPFYLEDPSYRPEHSWVAEEGGRLLAHLRVFDRSIRAGGAELRVAGIGNVITAPDQRGRGLAGRLLRAMLEEVPAEGFSYSLLRAYQPALYERHGWAPIEAEMVRATLDEGGDSTAIEPFSESDLPEVMRLYDAANAERSGTTVRTPEYWRSQLRWLEEDRDGFLTARTGDGTLTGYVRSRAGETATEILELGLRAGDVRTGRALLSAAAARSGGRLQAQLPPSLMGMFRPHEGEVTGAFGLMGRVLDVGALATALEPVWTRRLRESGHRGGSLGVSTGAGRAEIQVEPGGVGIEPRAGGGAGALDEGGFAHLLFRGFDEAAAGRLGTRPDSGLLRTLFPEQDFVVWRADAF